MLLSILTELIYSFTIISSDSNLQNSIR